MGETADKVALNATGCVTSWNSECILECFPFQKLYVFLFQDILVLTRPVTRNERQAFQVYRQPIPVQELLLEDLQDGDVKMGGSFRGAFGNSDKGMDPASSSVVAVSFQLGLGQGDIFVSLLDFGIGGGGFVGISNLPMESLNINSGLICSSLCLSPAKNIFRVRFQDPSLGQSHTLQANDVFHKQQWVNCIRTAIAPFQRNIPASELKELPELSEESEENNPSLPNIPAQKRRSGISEMELDESAAECGSVLDSEEAKGVKSHRTSSGHRKSREKQLSGKRKETLV